MVGCARCSGISVNRAPRVNPSLSYNAGSQIAGSHIAGSEPRESAQACGTCQFLTRDKIKCRLLDHFFCQWEASAASRAGVQLSIDVFGAQIRRRAAGFQAFNRPFNSVLRNAVAVAYDHECLPGYTAKKPLEWSIAQILIERQMRIIVI